MNHNKHYKSTYPHILPMVYRDIQQSLGTHEVKPIIQPGVSHSLYT